MEKIKKVVVALEAIEYDLNRNSSLSNKTGLNGLHTAKICLNAKSPNIPTAIAQLRLRFSQSNRPIEQEALKEAIALVQSLL